MYNPWGNTTVVRLWVLRRFMRAVPSCGDKDTAFMHRVLHVAILRLVEELCADGFCVFSACRVLY